MAFAPHLGHLAVNAFTFSQYFLLSSSAGFSALGSLMSVPPYLLNGDIGGPGYDRWTPKHFKLEVSDSPGIVPPRRIRSELREKRDHRVRCPALDVYRAVWSCTGGRVCKLPAITPEYSEGHSCTYGCP